MHPCIRASSPSLARAHELVASQHSPCSTFEPRHPCLGYANLQQRQRRLRRGNWCNSVRTNLFEVTYMPADIHLIPGTGGTVTFRARDGEAELTGTYSQQLPCLTASSPSLARARKHVAMQLSPCHRIVCAKGAPQVIGRCLATSFAPTAVGDTEGE